jgi:hypothetical protein
VKTILLLPVTISVYSQRLHHQILSSQTGNATLQAEGVKKFTIGQQSVTATKTNNLIIKQGFQQSNWDIIITTNLLDKK